MPEHSLRSKLFQLLWDQVFFFSSSSPVSSFSVEHCTTERGILSQCSPTVPILRSTGKTSALDCLSLTPFQSTSSVHRFNQPLLYFQADFFPYLLDGLSIDSFTFYFPALIIGLAPFQFSVHIWLGESNMALNIASNMDRTVSLVPSSSLMHPLKLSRAVHISTTKLLTDLS